MELNAVGPRTRLLQETGDFIRGDVNNNGGVVGMGHEELAEVGSDEASAADQADGEGGDLFAVQIEPRH